MSIRFYNVFTYSYRFTRVNRSEVALYSSVRK